MHKFRTKTKDNGKLTIWIDDKEIECNKCVINVDDGIITAILEIPVNVVSLSQKEKVNSLPVVKRIDLIDID